MAGLITNTSDCVNCGRCCVTGCHGQEIKCVLCDCCCRTIEVRLGPNQSINAGTIMAKNNNDGFYYPYNPSLDNGLDYPVGIMRRTLQTGADGRVTTYNIPLMGSVCGPFGVNIFIDGTFRADELFGNIRAAIANPSFGRLVGNLLKLA